MAKLTKRAVETAEPRAADYILWDSEVRGFGVRIRASGARMYVYKYRGPGGKQRKLTIGPHGNVTVDEARSIAKRAALEVA
jgi:hypothetical protein